MPEISIRMFPELGAPHHRPHFHAAYQEFSAVFPVDPIECIGGALLVEAWAEIHRDEFPQPSAAFTRRTRFALTVSRVAGPPPGGAGTVELKQADKQERT